MKRLALLMAILLLAPLAVGSQAPSGDAPGYICPMHPWVTSEAPGQCPICGMDLVPYDESPSGRSGRTIEIDPVTEQNMGVRLAPVRRGDLARSIRTVGIIDYAETRQTEVNSKIAGWVERLQVNRIGQPVTRGQPLLSLYSPDLVTAQEDYLLALRNLEQLAASSVPGVADGARRMLAASETRLRYWDIATSDIERLRQTGTVQKNLQLFAPDNGVVTERLVTQGMFVTAGMTLYRLADLSRVWVYADIYEYELPRVSQGMSAQITLPGEGRTLRGKVDLIYPFAEGATRTVKARIELPNPDGRLRPEMFVTVNIEGRIVKNALLVPSEAVLDSGLRQTVFVALGKGRFEPRQVHRGLRGDDGLVEIHGVEEGEQVVVSAQFMLDSESRLREAVEKMRRPASPEQPLDDLFGEHKH